MRAPTKKQWEKWARTGFIPHGTRVWCPTPGFNDGAYWFHWTGCANNRWMFNAGLICRTRAEAKQKESKMLEAIKP